MILQLSQEKRNECFHSLMMNPARKKIIGILADKFSALHKSLMTIVTGIPRALPL
jgi:hypothetical protein